MNEDFFVMLNTQNGRYTPMMGDEDNIATFGTKEEAEESAKHSVLGKYFGYEVFERGCGV